MIVKSFSLEQSVIDYVVEAARKQGKKQNRILKEAVLLHKAAYSSADDDDGDLNVDYMNECLRISEAIERGEVATISLKDFKARNASATAL